MASMDEHKALALAIQAAMKSPCSKSKRGVIIWADADADVPDAAVSAHNGPPRGFCCDGTDACRVACGKLCVHAEVRALMNASPDHTDLLHVKVVEGVAVPSGQPSCPDCSKAILDRGVRRVWLLHETGLRLYSAEDFHVQTLINSSLPVIRDAKPTDTSEST